MGSSMKMQFNPEPNKQANEVIFSRKSTNNLSYPPVRFNNNDIVNALIKNVWELC